MTNLELSASLLEVNINRPNDDMNLLLTQLAEAVEAPADISCLVGPVVKLLPCHHLHIKKAIYMIFPRLCFRIPEAALLAVNTILKDADDPNPAVQVLALGLLGSIPSLGPHADVPLYKSLSHSHPRVRRAAVSAAAHLQPGPLLNRTSGHQLIDRLYEAVRDEDPCVVTGALLALDALLVSEGGVVVRRQMKSHLVSRLDSFPPLQLASVLQVLSKYKPRDDDELFQQLSSLDVYLEHSSGPVVVACAQLYVTLLSDSYPHLEGDLIRRTVPALKRFISSGGPVARHVVSFLLEQKKQWLEAFSKSSEDIALFHLKNGDQPDLVLDKLKTLPYVCHHLEEVSLVLVAIESWWVNSGNEKTEFLKEAVASCIHKLAKRVPIASGHCLNSLLRLLDFETDNHMAKGSSSTQITWKGILKAILRIGLSSFGQEVATSAMSKILEGVDFTDKNLPDVIPALMAECGYMMEEGPYILEAMINNFSNYNDGTQHLLLSASMAMFFHRPASCQHALGRLLEKCLNISPPSNGISMELAVRAQQYFTLLKEDTALAEKLLLSTCS